jgi:hypothetical protein
MSSGVVLGVIYLIVIGCAILVAILTLLFFGMERLARSPSIARDGLSVGTRAPSWTLDDHDGRSWHLPDGRWKFLLFSDHSLQVFNDAVHELQGLHEAEGQVDVLVMSRGPASVTLRTLRTLSLAFPVIGVDERFYRRHRVRVMPYAVVVDGDGIVRASHLVSAADVLLTTWRVGTLLPLGRHARRAHAG